MIAFRQSHASHCASVGAEQLVLAEGSGHMFFGHEMPAAAAGETFLAFCETADLDK